MASLKEANVHPLQIRSAQDLAQAGPMGPPFGIHYSNAWITCQRVNWKKIFEAINYDPSKSKLSYIEDYDSSLGMVTTNSSMANKCK